MDSNDFLTMLDMRKDRMQSDVIRLLLKGDVRRALTAAGAVQCCQELQRELKFRLDAVERMKLEVEDRLRQRIERKQQRQSLKDAAKGRAA